MASHNSPKYFRPPGSSSLGGIFSEPPGPFAHMVSARASGASRRNAPASGSPSAGAVAPAAQHLPPRWASQRHLVTYLQSRDYGVCSKDLFSEQGVCINVNVSAHSVGLGGPNPDWRV